MKIRVATYNIHKGVTSLRSQPRVIALKKAIAEFNADVVFLQEVQGRHDRFQARYGKEEHAHRHWPETAQYDYFKGEKHHSAYGMNAVYDHGHHGNALLSAFPIENSHNHDVSDHAYEQRGILHCVLNTQAGKVHCYVVHLGLFEGSRGRQTDALIEHVNGSSHGEPVIIAGDFNDWRLKADAVLCEHLIEVFGEHFGTPARSFPARLPLLRLDRIYLRNAMPSTAKVLSNYPWSHLSDHAPLAAEINL